MKPHIILEDIGNIISCNDIPWEILAGKNILITGASGMIPGYIVDALLLLSRTIFSKNPINISVLVRNLDSLKERFKFHENYNDLNVILSDVSQISTFKLEYDFVIHAASLASPKHYGSRPVEVIEPNIIGTSNLCKFLVSQKTRTPKLLYVSSSEVYGNLPPDVLEIREDQFGFLDPFNVRSCYAESKRMGETLCKSYSHQYGLFVSIVRPFHTYGPGLKLDDGRVFADFVANAVKSKNIILNSDGSARRAFCYISDAVEGIFRVMLMGSQPDVFNIGNPGEVYSIYELAKIIEKISGNEKVQVVFSDNVDINGYIQSKVLSNIPNIQKISKFSWNPKITAEKGFERTIRSFRE